MAPPTRKPPAPREGRGHLIRRRRQPAMDMAMPVILDNRAKQGIGLLGPIAPVSDSISHCHWQASLEVSWVDSRLSPTTSGREYRKPLTTTPGISVEPLRLSAYPGKLYKADLKIMTPLTATKSEEPLPSTVQMVRQS